MTIDYLKKKSTFYGKIRAYKVIKTKKKESLTNITTNEKKKSKIP